MDREALAWAAGFFDGEGSISRKQIQVWQCDREVLDRMCAVVGAGKVLGPYTSHHRSATKADGHQRRPMYCLNISSFEKSQAVVALLWTWMGSVKRRQVARALADWGGVN